MTRKDARWIALLVSAQIGIASAARAKTTVHTYSYNVDGALTAITTQVNEQAPTTTYLTWDDFTPDAATPSTGTVTAGDGWLLGYGPSPGTDNLTARFAFDPRDRLVSYSGAAGTETYDYYGDNMMRSSSTDADERRFYYDAYENPQAVNLHDAAADRWSAWLDRTRFLDDGKEEILLLPRKDMACSYDAENATLQSYVYDAFGASPNPGAGSDTYDLGDNPFRYAGEYRDPIWGGYYLRARWYDPELPTFLSRDPERHLNRYAYGAGNPVMNTDPSGYGIESFLRHLDRKLNAGVGGHFARIFLAPLVGPLEIAAYPKQFWQSIKTDKDGIDIFLALGVVSEIGGGIADSYIAGYGVSLGRRFLARAVSDVAIGVGGSVGQGADRGFKHFDWQTFTEGVELTAGSVVNRGINSTNVASSFQLSGEDVVKLAARKLDAAPDHTALVFRQRTAAFPGQFAQEAAEVHSPVLEALKLGYYHERLIAVTKDEILLNDATDEGVRLGVSKAQNFAGVAEKLAKYTSHGKFEFVGAIDLSEDSIRAKFLGNQRNLPVDLNESGIENHELRRLTNKWSRYSPLTNNCQHHAYAVLQDLGLR
jgi:RHS repeat-associated protein